MSIKINTYNNYTTETAKNTSSTKKYANSSEYAKYLSEKYAYFGRKANVYGVPTTITVSSAYLKKCADNPEEAKVLERNLSAVPECTKQGEARLKSVQGSPVTIYRNVSIDENGHISSVSGCTNDPDGKIARENALKKAKEKKEKEERLEKKKKESLEMKKEWEERLAAKRNMQSYEVKATGNDMQGVTEKMVETLSNTFNYSAVTAGIDIKA